MCTRSRAAPTARCARWWTWPRCLPPSASACARTFRPLDWSDTMLPHWTFAQKISAGFALVVALALAIAVASIVALRGVVAGNERLITQNFQTLLDTERMQSDL